MDSSDFFGLITRSYKRRTLFLLRTARLSLGSTSSIMDHSWWLNVNLVFQLAQPDNLQAQRILFCIGFFTNEPEHLFRVFADRSAARRRHLFGDFDDPIRGGDRIKPTVLHGVETAREGREGLAVQFALFRCHAVCDSRKSCRRLGRSTGPHVACWSYYNVDAEMFHLCPVDGRKHLGSCFRCARWTVKRKRQARSPGTDLDDASMSLSECRQEGVHHGQGAEHIDLKLVPNGIERQKLQGAGGQDSGIVDEKVKSASSAGCNLASPTPNRGGVCNVADDQRYRSTGRPLEVFDLL